MRVMRFAVERSENAENREERGRHDARNGPPNAGRVREAPLSRGSSTVTKARKLRELMARPGPIVIIGAHNGLSARIGEQAGFDGLWATGFEISASYAVPDANILTMAENLSVAKMMGAASSLPIVADCDNGYGNAINVIRCVEEYEAAGIAAISIEDNIFPKRCSFYAGVKREL